MRTLDEAGLLNLWEDGSHRHPLDRALLALLVADPESAGGSPADWPVGRRNQALAQLYSRCFGPQLRGWVACVHCGEKLEVELNAGMLAEDGGRVNHDRDEPVVVNGRSFRLPTSRDLAAVANERDVASAAARLAESCLLAEPPPAEWPVEELSAIGEKMALADPLAEIRLALHCPDCGRDWEETLDLISFVWAKIETRARQALLEIHTLASAYGWTEADVLALSDARRAMYLEMVQP